MPTSSTSRSASKRWRKPTPSGNVQYDRSPAEVTCFLNNVGLGMQFAALGALLLEVDDGTTGKEIPTEWFLQDIPPR